MNWSAVAAVLLAVAVGLGAFGAHGLKGRLDAYSMDIWQKAVLYHFFHAFGLLIVALMPRIQVVSESSATWICALLFAGVLFFSGSLYGLALSGVTVLGAITPIGGVAFIAAWLLLAWHLLRAN